jgi:hypothetical protein
MTDHLLLKKRFVDLEARVHNLEDQVQTLERQMRWWDRFANYMQEQWKS